MFASGVNDGPVGVVQTKQGKVDVGLTRLRRLRTCIMLLNSIELSRMICCQAKLTHASQVPGGLQVQQHDINSHVS